MKKLIILFLLFSLNSYSQDRYSTRTGNIVFFSSTPVEDIKAENNLVSSILDVKSGNFVFSVRMKSFEFENALMQEHFNEKYIHSDDFPTATFSGIIKNLNNINNLKNTKVIVSGQLTIHGVTKEISTEGYLTKENQRITGTASFIIKPEDFNIKIPSIVRDNIAKEIQINVDIQLTEM